MSTHSDTLTTDMAARKARLARRATLASASAILLYAALLLTVGLGAQALDRSPLTDVGGVACGVAVVLGIPLTSGWAVSVAVVGLRWRVANGLMLVIWAIFVWKILLTNPTYPEVTMPPQSSQH